MVGNAYFLETFDTYDLVGHDHFRFPGEMWRVDGVVSTGRERGGERAGGRRDERRRARRVCGGVFAITVTVLGMAMFSGVAFLAARLGDPPLVRAFTDTGNIAIEISKFGFAVFVLAVSSAGAAPGVFPRWLVRLGVMSVPIMVVSAVALFVEHGIFQFGGGDRPRRCGVCARVDRGPKRRDTTERVMTSDLAMLTASAVLTGCLVLPYGLAMWTHWRIVDVLGNREAPPSLPPWAERARRAHWNMLENFPHFAALVLVANVSGLSNTQTALGATVFFWARVAHAIIYTTGVWRLRALAYFAGVGGELLILARILSGAP